MNSDRESYQPSLPNHGVNHGVSGEDDQTSTDAAAPAATTAVDNDNLFIGLTSSQSEDSMNVSSVTTNSTTTSSRDILARPSKRQKTENGWIGIARASLLSIGAVGMVRVMATSSDPLQVTASGALGFVAGMYFESNRKPSGDESSCDRPDDTISDHLTPQSPTSTPESSEKDSIGKKFLMTNGGLDNDGNKSTITKSKKKRRKKEATNAKNLAVLDAALKQMGGGGIIYDAVQNLVDALKKKEKPQQIRERLKTVAFGGNEEGKPKYLKLKCILSGHFF